MMRVLCITNSAANVLIRYQMLRSAFDQQRSSGHLEDINLCINVKNILVNI
jgi:hypothetical protein